MPKVTALYRYLVKGLTPEPVEHITVLPGGRVAGDRVLNFRFADAPVAEIAWCRKYHGVVLANTPGLARLNVRFDDRTPRLTIYAGNKILADNSLDEAGRQRVVDAITDYGVNSTRPLFHRFQRRLPCPPNVGVGSNWARRRSGGSRPTSDDQHSGTNRPLAAIRRSGVRPAQNRRRQR